MGQVILFAIIASEVEGIRAESVIEQRVVEAHIIKKVLLCGSCRCVHPHKNQGKEYEKYDTTLFTEARTGGIEQR